jgi:hypothetical protein
VQRFVKFGQIVFQRLVALIEGFSEILNIAVHRWIPALAGEGVFPFFRF